MDIQARSTDEAVQICKKLKESGRATFFRGQTKNWPSITPTLLRLRDTKRQQSIQKLRQFIEWAISVPQMAPYADSREALVAIAQHYGLPTTFLDLTTSPEIAAFFSKRSDTRSQQGQSVIYCLAEQDLSHIKGLQVVQLDVANLWRLQAQHGLFLEFQDEEAVPDLQSIAIRVHFPTEQITEQEQTYLYPIRKSALENVLDQWFYRHEIDTMMNDLQGIPRRLVVKRYSYPGAFQWRTIPELPPQWVGEQASWFLPKVEPSTVLQFSNFVSISPLASKNISAEAAHIRSIVEPPILDSIRSGKLLTFSIKLDLTVYPLVAGAEKLLNRVWDGVRTLPYTANELVTCISLVASLVISRALGHDEIDRWHETLWGETDLLEVAPVGGHIEAGFVSKKDLVNAFAKNSSNQLTSSFRRLADANPRDLMTFVVDPWILFNFDSFKRLFVEQFIPSAVDGFWKEDIGLYDGELQCMWSVPFNPALLGYVTNKDYRFRSPLAHEPDIERVIYVTPDMDTNDIEEAFVYCLPYVLDTGNPFQVRFTGYEHDAREIWQIEIAVQQCKDIVAVSGISVLEVTTAARDSHMPRDPLDKPGLGALEIWLIANGLLDRFIGKSMENLQPLMSRFEQELIASNADLEARAQRRYMRQQGT